ncbi:anti-anti-sigma factor [Mycolicibacterium agri]|uniref:Anti-anti-sigma factor n=1 Tax=Mycolicibacterium agri TaxID=36811 RepID=A0A2A7N852_MYCAG|nr:STAS domain-containing protein [Mycolicibacterium agri]PEG39953.1 anti-anti-sigma factor [Mycolicibacterium agri]GFG51454.1 anti-sigma factor antagonist [Mycolicibacterium agri]
MNLSLTVESTSPSASVHITGDLDYVTTAELVDTVTRLLAEQPTLQRVHIVCSGLTFCDSAGLSGLLQIHRKASAAHVSLHLDDRPATLERLLRVTGTFEHLTASDEDGTASSDAGAQRLSDGDDAACPAESSD